MGKSKYIKCKGTSLSITEWSQARKIPKETISNRLRQGWSIEEALGFKEHKRGVPEKVAISKEMQNKICKMYKSGMELKQICEKLEVGYYAVYNTLKAAGHKVKRATAGRKKTKEDFAKREQPCWHCKKYAGGCSWSRDFTPVEGWTAEKVLMGSGTETYEIKECPELVSDGTEI